MSTDSVNDRPDNIDSDVDYMSVGSSKIENDIDEIETNSSNIINDKQNNLIDELYMSMSKIIESLSLDNLLLNKQIQKLKSNVDELNARIYEKKDISNEILLQKITHDVEELKQKYDTNIILNNRNLFLQLINDMRKEFNFKLNQLATKYENNT